MQYMEEAYIKQFAKFNFKDFGNLYRIRFRKGYTLTDSIPMPYSIPDGRCSVSLEWKTLFSHEPSSPQAVLKVVMTSIIHSLYQHSLDKQTPCAEREVSTLAASVTLLAFEPAVNIYVWTGEQKPAVGPHYIRSA